MTTPDEEPPPFQLFLLTRSSTFLGMMADILEHLAEQTRGLRTVEECRALLVGQAERYREMGRPR